MDRFEYGLPNLGESERSVFQDSGVRLYNGEEKTNFENGDLLLTTHRMLWGKQGEIARGQSVLTLPLCYVVFAEEESTGFGFSKKKKIILHLSNANPSKEPGPFTFSPYNYIKLSFHLPQNEFYSLLNSILQQKKWEMPSSLTPTHKQNAPIKLRTGIVGIERGIQEKAKATDESISVAFQDLSKLMRMAKEMVHLSRNISQKIRDRQGDITEDETIKFKSYLLSLGIDDPVTRDAYKTESQFHKNLAQQISDFLVEPLTDSGGTMSLADAYCRINRARGLELLSPEDFLSACQLMTKLAMPIRMRSFESGVKVLQIETLSDENIAQTTNQQLIECGFLTAELLADTLGISVLLAKERLLTTEKLGKACRDESIEGLKFYPNRFLEL